MVIGDQQKSWWSEIWQKVLTVSMNTLTKMIDFKYCNRRTKSSVHSFFRSRRVDTDETKKFLVGISCYRTTLDYFFFVPIKIKIRWITSRKACAVWIRRLMSQPLQKPDKKKRPSSTDIGSGTRRLRSLFLANVTHIRQSSDQVRTTNYKVRRWYFDKKRYNEKFFFCLLWRSLCIQEGHCLYKISDQLIWTTLFFSYTASRIQIKKKLWDGWNS